VSEAKDELSTRIDQAEKERERLQRELEEYCELMGREVPDIIEVPELEEEVSSLYEDLLDKIGANGEKLLEFLLGKSDELPEDQETGTCSIPLSRFGLYYNGGLNGNDTSL